MNNLVKTKVLLKDLKPGMIFPFPSSNKSPDDYGLIVKTKIIKESSGNHELVEFKFLYGNKIYTNKHAPDSVISILSFQ